MYKIVMCAIFLLTTLSLDEKKAGITGFFYHVTKNYIDADADADADAEADSTTGAAGSTTTGAGSTTTGAAGSTTTGAGSTTTAGADASLLPQATKPRANKETSKSDFFMFLLSINRSNKITMLR